MGAGFTYMAGFWMFFSVLGPAQYGSPAVDASEHVRFLTEHAGVMTAWYQVIYILNAVLMVFLVAGLHRRIRAAPPELAFSASAFGVIWAGLILATGMLMVIAIGQIVRLAGEDMSGAVGLWRATTVVGAGLGGGNEITGGIWIFLVSLACWTTKSLPLPINLLGLLVGASGIVSTVPLLALATMVFGLGGILWFLVLGAWLLWAPEFGDGHS